MLPDGGEARQEQENGTKNPIPGDGFGVQKVGIEQHANHPCSMLNAKPFIITIQNRV